MRTALPESPTVPRYLVIIVSQHSIEIILIKYYFMTYINPAAGVRIYRPPSSNVFILIVDFKGLILVFSLHPDLLENVATDGMLPEKEETDRNNLHVI